MMQATIPLKPNDTNAYIAPSELSFLFPIARSPWDQYYEDYPRSIAQFSQLSMRSPDDTLILDGLRLARSLVAYPSDLNNSAQIQPEKTWWPGALNHPFVPFASLLAWCFFWVVITRWFFVRSRFWIGLSVFFAPIMLAYPLNLIVQLRRANIERTFPSVVVKFDTVLRSGNGWEYSPKLELPRGVEARLITRRNGWMQIEFASGLVGWIREETIISKLDKPHAP